MEQLTINQLAKLINKEIAKGNGNKKIIISDDVEGNGYHGLWYGFTSKESDIKEIIEYCNGISDSEKEDPNEIVILG